MNARILFAIALTLAAAVPAQAQLRRVEMKTLGMD
jgi:hypothetical protein